jgi:starch synthase (maltosyl-transferring)
MTPAEIAPAPARPVVEDVRPRVDDGRYDAKGSVGDSVTVEADAFLDGHDLLAVEVQYRHETDRRWSRERMVAIGNDRWRGHFTPTKIGRYRFQVQARTDHFATWLHDLRARVTAGQDVAVELLVGADYAQRAAAAAKGKDRERLEAFAADVLNGFIPDPGEVEDAILAGLVAKYAGSSAVATSPPYGIRIERERARFSTWYELFPRSASSDPEAKHGTFLDVIDRLDYLRELGVDVLYLPPIHPIGSTKRKGRNGAVTADPADVGSPWAIGAKEGGHTAIHPSLGNEAEFGKLVGGARDAGIEVALDLAFQCSPDHPWVGEHPEWFKHRPDGSIRYAENPPKKYEDIYPLDFESAQWRELWDALLDVVMHWIGLGITIFRVDNPHTKPFAFWEWLIPTVQAQHEDVIFLAEAFTRPKIMKRLAKLGFTQSYTYFAWRTQKWELEEYLIELTKTDMVDYFRPNFWPNTPDILTEQLQHGDRRTFVLRALLAGTLAANYGIYGPPFELTERAPRHAGSEEYLDGEKYQVRHWDLDDPRSIAPFLSKLNAIRHQQAALQYDRTLTFHPIDNEQLLVYSKIAPPSTRLHDGPAAAPILVVANLDDRYTQSGWVDLDLSALGIDGSQPYVAHDLLADVRYRWEGPHNFVMLDPNIAPGHIFRLESIDDAPRERVLL